MLSRFSLILLLLLATACSKNDDGAAKLNSGGDATSATQPEATPGESDAAKIKAAELAEAAKLKAEAEAAALRVTEAKEKFETLNDELKVALKAHANARRNAKTADQRKAWLQANPMNEFGEKFVNFAKEYEGTDQASRALETMTSTGTGPSKMVAMNMLLDTVDASLDEEKTYETLSLIATRGSGTPKAKAVEMLIDDYVNDEKMIDVMATMVRGLPTPQNDKWLKQICATATDGKVKGNAIINRISMLDRVKSFKSFLDGAKEEQLKAYDEELIEFVNAERDPNELKDLEKLLETFVKENEGVVAEAESTLYVLKNLSVGCEAPDIEGLDLDGEEFNLSDYRGKVVFLDFWGDW